MKKEVTKEIIRLSQLCAEYIDRQAYKKAEAVSELIEVLQGCK